MEYSMDIDDINEVGNVIRFSAQVGQFYIKYLHQHILENLTK